MKTRHNKSFAIIVGYCIFVLIVLIIIASLASCNTTNRAIKQASKIQASHPEVMASACASFYPTKDSVHESIQYKEGATIERKVYDTVSVNCDSLADLRPYSGKLPKYNIIHIPCPPCDSMRVDTVLVDNYKQVQNTGKVIDMQNKLNTANQTISAKDNTIKWLKWIAISGWALIVVVIAWKVFKPKVL